MVLSSDLKRFTFWAVATGFVWGVQIWTVIVALATGDYSYALGGFALGIGVLAFFIIAGLEYQVQWLKQTRSYQEPEV